MDITEQDYELLSQYLDGELPEYAARLLEQRLAAEAPLRTCLERLGALNDRLRGAYDGIESEAVPQRIAALLQDGAPHIVPLPHRRTMHWGFALAASLVVAVSATLVTQVGRDSVGTGSQGMDVALSLALEQAPSRATGWEILADGRNLRPVLSFQDRNGAWCREYLLADGHSNWHGVACRGDSGWNQAVLVTTQPAGSSDDYRPAGAADSDQIAEFVDRNAADIPLDHSQEAELISRNWQ